MSGLGFLADEKNLELLEPKSKITALTQKLEEMDEKMNQIPDLKLQLSKFEKLLGQSEKKPEEKKEKQSSIEDMLAVRPVGAAQVCLEMWDNTKNTRLELLLKGWQHFSPNTPLPSLEEAPIQEWGNFKGQRKANGDKHGVVRETTPDGTIREGTYKNDRKEGLEIRW